MKSITPVELDGLLADGGSRAFVDVSDVPEYNEGAHTRFQLRDAG